MKQKNLLEIKELSVGFKNNNSTINVLNDISLDIKKNEILGIAGESGSGKSVLALSTLKLLPKHSFINKGSILFGNRDILSLNEKEMQKIRGREIGIIFQDPSSSLSPLLKIRKQIKEAILFHSKKDSKEIEEESIRILEKLNIKDARQKLNSYPYELSGGLKQRIIIAISIMQSAKLIIADEPTTALDVTTQAQILDIFKKIKKEGTSILFISHNLGVINKICDRVAIIYASNIVEEGATDDIFSSPKHPYTKALLKAIPELTTKKKKLDTIAGQILIPSLYGNFCHFHNRCPFAFERCRNEKPKLKIVDGNRKVACFLEDKK